MSQQPVDLNNEINYLFGYAGVAIALTFANLGAAYGTA
jgi:hypothetical protein